MKRFLIITALFFSFSAMSKNKPNAILILADDLGYSDVSSLCSSFESMYDHPSTGITPNIDRLASEGIRFTQFYCGAAVCSPSRAALMTDLNATRVGIYNWIPEGLRQGTGC